MGIHFKDDHMLYTHFRTEAAKKDNYYKHSHNEYELLFFLSGNADYILEDTVLPLEPNDLVLIKPKTYHMLSLKSPEPAYERVNISFNSLVFEKSALDELFAQSHKLSFNSISFFSSWIKRMDYNLEHYKSEDVKLAVHTLLTELLLALKNFSPTQTSSPVATNNPAFNRALQYVNENIKTIKNTKDVAQNLFYSESYLYLLFKKNLNTCPKKYIMEKKLLLAEEYIRSGMKLNDVYTELGFEDYSSFFRAFKKQYGFSPSTLYD